MKFRNGDAKYTQAIHTSFVGVTNKVADDDIYLDYKSESIASALKEKHGLGLYMHVATSTKRLFLIAEENGNGTMVANNGLSLRELKQKECLIGIYGTSNHTKNRKKFKISLNNREQIKRFWDLLGEFREYALIE